MALRKGVNVLNKKKLKEMYEIEEVDVFEINRQDYEHQKIGESPRIFKAIFDTDLRLIYINRSQFAGAIGKKLEEFYTGESLNEIKLLLCEALTKPGVELHKSYTISTPFGLAHVADDVIYVNETIFLSGIVERVT